MECPKCKSTSTRTVDSRKHNGIVQRRRECKDCKYRFNTVERALVAFGYDE